MSAVGASCRYIYLLDSQLAWLAGATAVSATILLMILTNTVFPPAGATALSIATTADPILTKSGFLVIAMPVLFMTVIMVTIAFIFGNIFSTYPKWWI